MTAHPTVWDADLSSLNVPTAQQPIDLCKGAADSEKKNDRTDYLRAMTRKQLH